MKIVPGNEVVRDRVPNDAYKTILDYMPLACTDSVVYRIQNKEPSILMVERKEPPAQGMLWFPGGRILKNQSFEETVRWKLKQECGLEDIVVERQIGGFQFSSREGILPELKHGFHAIAVNYLVRVPDNNPIIQLDHTSKGYAWQNWKALSEQPRGLHPYIAEVINASGIFGGRLENIDYSFER